MRRSITALAVLAALTACTPIAVDAPSATSETTTAEADLPVPSDAASAVVERVVDGDTIIVELDGERERVRLLRIDTPELAHDGEGAECLADASRIALEGLLPAGATVQLAEDVEQRDRFGRLLAHVWIDGTWVNGAMLRDGWANLVTFPPNVAYDAEVRAAMDAAVETRVGLWQPGVC